MVVLCPVPGIFSVVRVPVSCARLPFGGGGSGNADCCGTRSRAVELQGVLRCKMRCILLVGVGRVDCEGGVKEGPYQDRPPLCPFRLSPLLTCS